MGSFRNYSVLPLLFILSLLLAVPVAAADYTDPVTGMEFVLIKGGTFTMGTTPDNDQWSAPPHEVTVKDFYIGKFEVTFDQFDAFCDATGFPRPDDEGWGRGDRPVINLRWEDAKAFVDWMSKSTGKKFRLPSEAQWEYAARGGTETAFWWGDQMKPGMANCLDCGTEWDNKGTAPVGSFPPNPYGLYDMTGNIYEWCYDTVHKTYENAPSDDRPWMGGKAGSRINRGGSWAFESGDMRTFLRCWDNLDARKNSYGLRVVMVP